jgi:hypothetical protein
MQKPRIGQQLRRRVWRVTAAAPLGEVVDVEPSATEAGTHRQEAANATEPREFGWRQSSLDLSDGLEVCEDQDTVPADLFDELFKR